ncbi:MAG TPA: hypothetical protein PL193_02550 [Xanthobacteraceae bacterium]|nr:hypothetical protein [Xanthobacteraceae bacterium]
MPLAPKIAKSITEVVEKENFQYYIDLAGEICRRVESKAHLSDDEIIVLSLVASQLVLAKYIEPGERDSDEVLNKIFGLLDRDELNAAVESKMITMLSDYAPQSRTRDDAPSGKMVQSLGIEDPDEPAPDPDPAENRRTIKSV